MPLLTEMGILFSEGLVAVELITEIRKFWIDTCANFQPEKMLDWTPYYVGPNVVLFDHFRTNPLFRSYNYLWNSLQNGSIRDLAFSLSRMRN